MERREEVDGNEVLSVSMKEERDEVDELNERKEELVGKEEGMTRVEGDPYSCRECAAFTVMA